MRLNGIALVLGSALLKHIIQQAKLSEDVSQIYLHVQVSNTAAADFYKKNEFQVISTEKDYYKHIEPRDAYLLAYVI